MTEQIERATAADERDAAFDGLVAAELDGAYRLAGVILGDRWQAEDATHDAVVQAWLRFGSLREQDRFGAWFGRILVNICRDRLREKARRPISVRAVADTPTDDRPTAVADRLLPAAGRRSFDARLPLDAALSALSPARRVALALRYYAALPVEAIAELVGVP